MRRIRQGVAATIRSVFSPQTQVVFSLLAIVIATVALLVAWRHQRYVELRLDNTTDPTSAEYILQRANDATQFADSILSFLEGASAVIGVVLVVGGWMFRNSVQRQIEQARGEVARVVDESQRFLRQAQDDLAQRQRAVADLEAKLLARMDDIEARARDSFRVVSLQLLAEQQVRAHNVETALSTLQTAHDLDPQDPATNYLLGYLYTSQQQIDKAIEHLERALQREPEFTPGIAALGLALRRKADRIDKIKDKTPAQMEERNKLWAQAETNLLEALQRDSSLTDADGQSYYGTLGGLYRRQKRYDDALNGYERAHRVTPDSSYPIINLAAIYTHQGNLERARYFFEQVVKQAELGLDDDPRNTWTRCDLAQARLVLGEQAEALHQIDIVIDQKPEPGVFETVLNGLAFLAESPLTIEGIDEMMRRIEAALAARGPRNQDPA